MTFHQVAVSGVNSNNYKNGIGRFCMYDAYSRMEILLGQKGVDCRVTPGSQFSDLAVRVPIQWRHWHAVE